MKKKSPKYRKAWAVQFKPGARLGYRHPCLFGSRAAAREAKDRDEHVVQIEYRILKVEG